MGMAQAGGAFALDGPMVFANVDAVFDRLSAETIRQHLFADRARP